MINYHQPRSWSVFCALAEGQRFAEHIQPPPPPRRFAWKGLGFVIVITVLMAAFIWRFARDRQEIAPVAPVAPETVEQGPEGALSASTRMRMPVNANAPQLQITETSPEPVAEAAPTQEPRAPLQDDVQRAAEPATGTEVVSDDGLRLHQAELESAPMTSAMASSETPLSEQVHSSGTPSSLLMLQVMALEDTWLRVEIDGEQRHTLLLVAGKSIEWEADERFMLTVGNAHGTRLVLNGRDVSLPPTGNNVVRDFILTRNMVN
jgi:hypothetical protein